MFILDGERRFLITLTCTCEQSDNTNVQRVARRRAFSLPRRRSWGFVTRSCPTYVPAPHPLLEGLLEEPKERLRGRPEGLVSPVPLDLLYSVFKYRPRLNTQ